MQTNLIEENQGLVVTIAKMYYRKHFRLEFEDLVAEGNIGLYHAIQTHKSEKGQLSTYAYYWIRKYIQNAVQKHASIVYLPYYVTKLLDRYHDIKTRLIHSKGYLPDVDEVIDEMHVSMHERGCIKKALQVIVREMESD